MRNIIVCTGDIAERNQILEDVCRFFDTLDESVRAQGCADWPELAQCLEQDRPEILILAQDGVEGLDTLTGLTPLPIKVIWFSDLDFGVQSYRLCVTYFGKKPVTYQKLASALCRCTDTNGNDTTIKQ